MNIARQHFRIYLLLIVMVLFVLPTVAYASLLCRSDPIVKLTNGVKLEIGASIAAAQSDVIVVNYELHVPRGVGMAKPEHTPGWSDINETFTFFADQPANQYYVVTTVRTRTGTPAFTAYTNVKDDTRSAYQTSGAVGQTVVTPFTSR